MKTTLAERKAQAEKIGPKRLAMKWRIVVLQDGGWGMSMRECPGPYCYCRIDEENFLAICNVLRQARIVERRERKYVALAKARDWPYSPKTVNLDQLPMLLAACTKVELEEREEAAAELRNESES